MSETGERIDLRANSHSRLEEVLSLVAGKMPQVSGRPDGELLLKIDVGAKWMDVKAVLDEASGEGIWNFAFVVNRIGGSQG